MEVASLGYIELCEFLLDRGADIDVRNTVDETVFSKAANTGQQPVLKMLLNRLSAETDINDYFDSVDADMTLKREGEIAELVQLLAGWAQGCLRALRRGSLVIRARGFPF